MARPDTMSELNLDSSEILKLAADLDVEHSAPTKVRRALAFLLRRAALEEFDRELAAMRALNHRLAQPGSEVTDDDRNLAAHGIVTAPERLPVRADTDRFDVVGPQPSPK